MIKIIKKLKKKHFIQDDNYQRIDSKKFYPLSRSKFLKMKCECHHLQQYCR